MKNLESIFAAYLIGWSIFFALFLSIVKRTNDLRSEVKRLKNTLKEK